MQHVHVVLLGEAADLRVTSMMGDLGFISSRPKKMGRPLDEKSEWCRRGLPGHEAPSLGSYRRRRPGSWWPSLGCSEPGWWLQKRLS
jgi:hypothetical protein